jgi:hypothetical protein
MAAEKPKRSILCGSMSDRDGQSSGQALTLRLPPELHDQLRAVAAEDDRSIAGILRSAAREFLATREDAPRS